MLLSEHFLFPRMSFIILKKRSFLYLKWNFPMTLSDRRKVGRTILWLVGPMVVRSVGISVGWYVIISSFNYHASVGALFNFKHGRSCNETIMISSLCWPNPWRFWSLVSLQPLHWFMYRSLLSHIFFLCRPSYCWARVSEQAKKTLYFKVCVQNFQSL